MKPGKVCAPMDSAASNGVIHQRRNWRVLVVDGIVDIQASDIRVRAEIRLAVEFPIVVGRRVGRRVHPSALL